MRTYPPRSTTGDSGDGTGGDGTDDDSAESDWSLVGTGGIDAGGAGGAVTRDASIAVSDAVTDESLLLFVASITPGGGFQSFVADVTTIDTGDSVVWQSIAVPGTPEASQLELVESDAGVMLVIEDISGYPAGIRAYHFSTAGPAWDDSSTAFHAIDTGNVSDCGALDGTLSAALTDGNGGDDDLFVAYYEAPATEGDPAEIMRVYGFDSDLGTWTEVDSSALSPDSLSTADPAQVNSPVSISWDNDVLYLFYRNSGSQRGTVVTPPPESSDPSGPWNVISLDEEQDGITGNLNVASLGLSAYNNRLFAGFVAGGGFGGTSANAAVYQ